MQTLQLLKKNRTLYLFKCATLSLVLLLINIESHAQRRVDSRTFSSQIACGESSSYQIVNGTLWAWGDNAYGQLGDGSTTDRHTPTQIGSLNNWISIAAGSNTAIGIQSDGTLWGWGYNAYGQVGDGSTTDRHSPVQIGTDTKWIRVVSKTMFTLGIKSDGTLWAWGYNNETLGDGTTTQRNSPVQIGTDTKWINISAGAGHSIGLKSDGTIWTWGSGTSGILGDGTQNSSNSPVQVGSDTKWVDVSASDATSYAVKSDGTLWAWGWNYYGALGDGTTTDQLTPQQIGTDTKWIDIEAGTTSVTGIKTDGTLWSWGHNYGQLGDGTTSTDRHVPTQIGTDTKWCFINSNTYHSVAIKSDGTLWAWGWNYNGQLGDGTTTIRTTPTSVSTGVTLNSWQTIVTGVYHTIGLKSDGTLWGWGTNNRGQLGDGTTVDHTCPAQIGTDNTWISIAAGNFHTLALKANGTLWAWGSNNAGQLGNGTTTNSNTPIQIGSDNTWIKVNASNLGSYAIKSDGTLWGWGYNDVGQLCDGTTINKTNPIQIGSDNKWISVSPSIGSSVLAIKSDGTLWAWGANNSGQLGDGTNTTRTSPVQVGSDNKWKIVREGSGMSVGIKSDGTLWTWGSNLTGGLGDGTTTNHNSPIQVGTDTKWNGLGNSFATHVVALKVNGTLWAWGANNSGQLGDGTNTNRLSPVQIGSDQTWLSASGSYDHTIGIKAYRTEFCVTGDNGSGQLGYCGPSLTSYLCLGSSTTNPAAPVNTTSSDASYILAGMSTILTASSNACSLTWYATSSSSTVLATGTSYTTPVLTSTTIYYVQSNNCGLASLTRTPITVYVNNCHNIPSQGDTAYYHCYHGRLASGENRVETMDLLIYPNPNNGTFTLQAKQEGIYSIVNELGQIVQTAELNEYNQYTLEIKQLNNGLYTVIGTDRTMQQRIVVMK